MGKGKAKAKGGAASKKTQQKRTEKIVEDKTFGLKNKNKSKKVQQYIAQVQSQAHSGGGKSQAYYQAQAAKRKKEKEAQKQAEKEMLALLGDAYALDKKKKKKQDKKKKEEEAKKQEEDNAKQKLADAKDFGIPICSLRDCFGLGSKATVERICAELVHKDNLPSKGPDGSPSIILKINDGTTLNPMTLLLIGETPQTLQSSDIKLNCVLDIRGCTAMVRGGKVLLEVPQGAQGLTQPNESIQCSVEIASERLTEYIRQKIEEEDEIRAQGGIPIEERIEEERANLKTRTPVTHERFMAWKAKKVKEKLEAEENKKKDAAKKGKNILTGKDLFKTNQSLFVDDENAVANDAYEVIEEEEEADDTDTGATAATPPNPPGDTVGAIQEKLYLEGDDDLDDLDDLDDDDE